MRKLLLGVFIIASLSFHKTHSLDLKDFAKATMRVGYGLSSFAIVCAIFTQTMGRPLQYQNLPSPFSDKLLIGGVAGIVTTFLTLRYIMPEKAFTSN